MNRLTVYRLISTEKELSKAQISRITGISAPTVLKIMDFFLDNGLVVESGEGDSALGRKPQLLRFNPDAFFSLGVLLEGRFLSMGLVNLAGEVRAVEHVILDDLSFDRVLRDSLAGSIESFLARCGRDRSVILGIGLGIPAVLQDDGKVIVQAPIMGIHEPRNYGESFKALGERLGLGITVENDVNAAAVGEFVHRGLAEDDELVYVSLGTGLGAGLILNGRLRRGRRGLAGELGSMVFDPGVVQDRGEPGWLESRVNLAALKERFGIDARDVERSAQGESPRLAAVKGRVVDYLAAELALCVANFPAQLDVPLLVLGGVITESLGAELVLRTRSAVAGLCGFAPAIETARCSEAGIVGAASLVTEEKLPVVLADPGYRGARASA